MTTVADLGFRNFLTKKGTSEIIGSNTEKCKVATRISFEDFMSSKEPGRKTRAIPYSGHQILTGIQNRISSLTNNESVFGQVFVYRDSMSHPGYVSKMTPETASGKLLMPTTSISELSFDRFIGTIDLFGDTDANVRLAVKYEEDKFEMALGTNIRICENFNIFGGKHMSTQRGITYEDLMEDLDVWITNVEEEFKTDLRTINALAMAKISRNDVHQYLGEMMEMYHSNNQVLPITDISALTQKIVTKKEIHSLWDVTQAGTEVIRFDNNSGAVVLDTVKNWNNYILSKLN